MKEVRRSNPQKIGDAGESILKTALTFHGSVNKFETDMGIDFICSMISERGEYTGETFLAQCKGTESYDSFKNEFNVSVKTSTVRYWMKQRNLTFLFCVDIDTEKIYWVNPIEQLEDKMKIIADNQQTITIKVPQKNIFTKNSFPEEMFNCMKRFDEKLFSGYFVQVNKDMDTFSNADYFSDDIVVSDGIECINIKCRNVHLTGFYWSHKEYHSGGSCLIQIVRHVKKAENDLTFNHQQILNLFYQGMNTNLDYGMRKYVKEFMENDGQFIVDLGNSRIYLYPDEVKDLCRVIDTFAERYLRRITKYLKQIGSLGFEPFKKDLKLYKLMTVDIKIWKLMISYTKSHIFSNGSYEADYKFSQTVNEDSIELLNKDGNTLFLIEGYRKLTYFNTENIKVDIVWKYLDEEYYRNSQNILYSVAETYEFIVRDLLANIFVKKKEVKRKGLFWSKIETEDMNLTKEEIEEIIPCSNYKIDRDKISSIRNLVHIFTTFKDFLRKKKYLDFDDTPYRNFCKYVEKRIVSDLSNYSEYSANWFGIEKKENDVVLETIKSLKSKKEKVDSYLYASIFSYLASILAEFADSFNTDDQYLLNLYKDFYKVISWYNEESLVKLLI
ncbi:DUF4365 domain-containing protein [Lysinibacillus sp. fls2-241-R2A-57]|uniref:DUF4365 domain-containing protein n=1 Tax=Lysinibacillus sp. fls2-241-R2A-57 TaxID=3040292 RepID=UPI0025558700|nr:DUF4365 domain-containing protein [Lysinibacillus sp. fls2-241-R2A-57]